MSIGNPGVFVNNASLHTFGRILLAMGAAGNLVFLVDLSNQDD
jgi:hypothetical protein